MKKTIYLMLIISLSVYGKTLDTSKFDKAYYERFKNNNMSINVYNWGEYISDGSDDSIDVNKAFEELTGIKVHYTTFASNEELYVKLKVGGVSYDVVFPSDYMVSRLVKENLIQKLDITKMPNHKYIMSDFSNFNYDPKGEYSVPYTWGVGGIIYNTKKVKELPEEINWDILFKDDYKGQILMYYNPRDSFGVAYAALGIDANTTNESEIREAALLLKKQKPLVQAYVMDEIYDKMESAEAAMGVYYAGDSLSMIANNPDLNFVVPKKGANRFIDAMAIPSSSKNSDAAHMYINFLNEAEVALANIEYTKYATPNIAAFDIMDTEMKENKTIYPPKEILDNTAIYYALPDETNILIESLWQDILTTDEVYKGWVVPIVLIVIIAISISIIVLKKKKKRS